MSSRLPLAGRVALVSGAGRGLGRAYAHALAARGARVAVNNRSGAAADDVVAAIRATGGEAIACVGDLERPGAAEQAVATTLDGFGRLDVVVANAGGIDGPAASFAATTAAERDTVLGRNLTTAWDLTAAAWPHLTAAGYGRVLLCGSPIAFAGAPGFAHYAAAKAALVGLGRTLAVEGASHGVTVNVLHPLADTQPGEPEGDHRRWYADTFRVEHVAAAVSWLVDERCAATGQIVTVGGPRVARVEIAESAGYVGDPAAFSAETVGAHFDDVLREAPSLRFAAITERLAHGADVHGPIPAGAGS